MVSCNDKLNKSFCDQAFGLHQHEETAEGDSHADHSEEKGFIWKALVVLLSIYGYFLFETLMHLCLKGKFGDHGGHSHIDVEVSNNSTIYCFKPENSKIT